jgi:hypothetical protein
MHNDNGFEDNVDCVAVTHTLPEGNVSLVNIEVYDKRWVKNN